MNVVQMKFKFSIGEIYICATRDSITGVLWHKPDLDKAKDGTSEFKLIMKAYNQINEYLQGKRERFEVPLYFNGTDFQNQVWGELLKIPFGKTISYSDLANGINNPKAVRAVGSANGKNPISIIIPCHRVIAKCGKLAGYAGGKDIKQELLNVEK